MYSMVRYKATIMVVHFFSVFKDNQIHVPLEELEKDLLRLIAVHLCVHGAGHRCRVFMPMDYPPEFCLRSGIRGRFGLDTQSDDIDVVSVEPCRRNSCTIQ